MLERYATERLAPAEKIRRWCDFGSSTLSRLTVRPYQPGSFRAQLVRAKLGEIGITHMSSTPALAQSYDGCVGDWAGSHDGALAINYYKAGHPRLTQAGRTLQFGPGDIVIRDLCRRWEHECSEDWTLVTLKVPTHCLDGAVQDLRSCIMTPLRAGDPRTDLLASLIESLGRIAFESALVPYHDPVERLLRSAIEVAFASEPYCEQKRGLPPEVVRYLESHLQDPELSVAGLAREFGLNIRKVQRLFHQAGTTPKAYILGRRLQLAANQLRNASGVDRASITQLAFSLGFNDPGYFSRVFHEKYGVTPTEYLRRHRFSI